MGSGDDEYSSICDVFSQCVFGDGERLFFFGVIFVVAPDVIFLHYLRVLSNINILILVLF